MTNQSRPENSSLFAAPSKYDINPIFGRENLIWAPNIAGQHTTEALQKVVDALKRANAKASLLADPDEAREIIVEALATMGTRAATL